MLPSRTLSTKPAFARSLFKKPAVIINTAAGSAADISDEIGEIFQDQGYPCPAIYLVAPEELEKAFQKVSEDNTDLLVIYGGDGTCKSGAVIARQKEIPIVTLPGGTMNMLPKALYGTDDWKEALTLALEQEKPRWCASGKINNKLFFCGAILGDPIVMSEAREDLRDGEIVKAVRHIPEIISAISEGSPFEFKVDGQTFDKNSNIMHLACPLVSASHIENGAFELASIPTLTLRELLSIGAIALMENWRNSPHVKSTQAANVTVTGQGEFDVLLDGEMERVTCPVNIEIEPKGVLVLAPDLKHERSI